MYNETNVPGPEYRVRTVVRYVVTRYCHPYIHRAEGPLMDQEIPGGSTLVGEFQNQQQAYEVAKALAVSESPAEATVSV